MQVVNFTEARNNLKSLFDSVYRDSQEIIINRKNGENVVIISLDAYNAMKETKQRTASELFGKFTSRKGQQKIAV